MSDISKTTAAVLERLSDGEFHSGEALGAAIQVSRAAIWKSIAMLERYGIPLNSVKGRGYQIPGGLNLIDSAVLTSLLANESPAIIVDVLSLVDSTNTYLLNLPSLHYRACVAEFQSAGRGRRGREWVSPFAQNIYLSLGYSSTEGLAAFDGFSLAVASVIIECLEDYGFRHLSVKWPNDILIGERKLAGILMEMRGDAFGDVHLVLGVGINVNVLSEDAMHSITQPWIDLSQAAAAQSLPLPDRTELSATLIRRLYALFNEFPKSGFAAYRDRWLQHCAFLGQMVVLQGARSTDVGVLSGVTAGGSLVLLCDEKEVVFHNGDVSLRAAP